MITVASTGRALAALRSREEAEALGKNTAVYLSGDAPRAAQG
jgi:hypothetical protein